MGALVQVGAPTSAQPRAPEPAPIQWLDAAGRLTADGREALALLASAGKEGLEPEDYCAAALTGEAASVPMSPDRARAAAAFDAELTANLVLYLEQLHEGRLDPRAVGFHMTAPPDHHDFGELVRVAGAAHRLGALYAEMAPQLPLYRSLRDMLARYRALAADPALVPPPAAKTIHPGEVYVGSVELHRLLVAVGDLPLGTPPPGADAPYTGVLVDGVRRFQARHGLAADGVLGATTQAALRVPLARRVRQIELALERLRWLPHIDPERLLVANVPTFRLVAWNADRTGPPALTMGIIVGRALDRETPVFAEEMTHVIFRPYWNVPLSIARNEILPAVRRNPGYLRKNDMEIVAGPGDDSPVVGATLGNLALVGKGKLRIRQRPGPSNALGLAKFVFPNDANVYMHGTPAQALFQRPRRDFSHGCIRVEDPVALAGWVLAGEQGWTRERILAAMAADRSQRVDLARPLQVLIFYVTAVVTAQDGAIHFADDVYGHDARLERALAGGGR